MPSMSLLGSASGALGALPVGVTVSGFKTGQVAGSTSAKKCPSHPCSYVRFKAAKSNTGGIFIGPDNSVAVESGTSDLFTTGWELESQEQTDWWPCKNLDEFTIICDNATDDLLFILIP